MAITLQQVIENARNRHPAFHKSRVPDRVLATHLSEVQRMLLTEGAELDASRVAVSAAIGFATSAGNVPGQVGAGSSGGLPAEPNSSGTLAAVGADTGSAVVLDIDDAPVLVADTVVASADGVSVTLAGVAWTVNQFANQIAFVSAGTGYFQKRTILSNTATKLVISTGTDGEGWVNIPDTTSLVRIVAVDLVIDNSVAVVTELPPRAPKEGYLVKLNAQGQPYLDIANPVALLIDNGIPLPAYERILGGTVRLKTTSGLDPLTCPLTIRTYRDRYAWGPTYTVWTENGQLFLSGSLADWANVISFDIRLVPIPADFEARTDLFLLPDLARPVLVAEAALLCAQRCVVLPDAGRVDVPTFVADRDRAFTNFQKAIGASRRAVAKYVHETW